MNECVYIVPALFLVNQELFLKAGLWFCPILHGPQLFSHDNLKSLVNISGLKHFGTSCNFKTT